MWLHHIHAAQGPGKAVKVSGPELLAALQGGIPLESRPFGHLAEELGCREEEHGTCCLF